MQQIDFGQRYTKEAIRNGTHGYACPMNWSQEDAQRHLYTWPFLTVRDVTKVLNKPRRKVALLAEQQILLPRDAKPGRGRAREYTFYQLVLFRIAFDLEGLGLKPRVQRAIMSDLANRRIKYPGDQLTIHLDPASDEVTVHEGIFSFGVEEEPYVFLRVVLTDLMLQVSEPLLDEFPEYEEQVNSMIPDSTRPME